MASSTLFRAPRPASSRTLKILLVGDFDCKSPIREHLAPSNINFITTIGIDYRIAHFEDTEFKIHDTAGQERFREIAPSYYRGVNIMLFCVKTGEELEKLYHAITNREGISFFVMTHIPVGTPDEILAFNLSVQEAAQRLDLLTINATADNILEILASANPKELIINQKLDETARPYVIKNMLIKHQRQGWFPEPVAQIVAEYDGAPTSRKP